jgi:hypothetical protein
LIGGTREAFHGVKLLLRGLLDVKEAENKKSGGVAQREARPKRRSTGQADTILCRDTRLDCR